MDSYSCIRCFRMFETSNEHVHENNGIVYCTPCRDVGMVDGDEDQFYKLLDEDYENDFAQFDTEEETDDDDQ